ncbi:CvpA family protein [Anaeromicropila herbilytica]|uniref:Colicin V production protein n=1 Tax=Anaeromicropila herbilytica TaxID=2785025 RepID=A0A7R7EHJ7_9FIRM|nr:CvpA family protein [Anaeromicropila herbilytica]BCN28858.1 hypothetical protein bsdtb5_01530 [Anaeromicropila herbilytica]
MNWLLGAVILVLAGYAIKGRHDGFIKTVFAIFSIVLSLVLSIVISPYISKTIQSNEKIYNTVNEKIAEGLKLSEQQKEDKNSDSKKTVDKEGKQQIKQKQQKQKSLDETDEKGQIEQLTLPGTLKDALIENNNSEVYKALAINSFEGYVSGYLTVIAINAFSFFITFLIIKIIFFVLSKVLDIISKLPILNGLNKTAGLLVGLLQGLAVIWVLCIVLTAFSTSQIGQELFKLINESAILSSIYNNNLLLNAITNIAKVLF